MYEKKNVNKYESTEVHSMSIMKVVGVDCMPFKKNLNVSLSFILF